jgi:hypothetical protein
MDCGGISWGREVEREECGFEVGAVNLAFNFCFVICSFVALDQTSDRSLAFTWGLKTILWI